MMRAADTAVAAKEWRCERWTDHRGERAAEDEPPEAQAKTGGSIGRARSARYAIEERQDGRISSMSDSVSGAIRGSTSSSAVLAQTSSTTARTTCSWPVACAPRSRARQMG